MTKPQEKAETAKKLLQTSNCILTPGAFMDGLVLAGLMEKVEYLSTSGSGEIKHFYKVSERGLIFGKNKHNPFHEIKTDPLFYSARFLELYAISCAEIAKHAQALLAAHIE